MGIEPTTSGFDLPLLCRLSYEAGQKKSGIESILSSTICAQHSYVPLLSLRRDSLPKIVPDFLCPTW